MRYRDVIETPAPLRPRAERLQELAAWLLVEVEDAVSSRAAQDAAWREMLRMYEGIPKVAVRAAPIENMPNTEVTIGAIASDSVYAQALDLIFSISPTITARPVGGDRVEHAKALQRWVNHQTTIQNFNFRRACEHAFLDDVQLGTGIFYIPFVEATQRTRTERSTFRGPRIFSLPVEDFFMPGGSYDDLQMSRWCGMRMWLTKGELAYRATSQKWNLNAVQPAGNVDWVRSRRESLGRSMGGVTRFGRLYEIWRIYAYYDIDGDGLDEDLRITYDRTSRAILRVQFNQYSRRPFESCVYQPRGHLFYGLGVLEMLAPYEEEVTEIHVHRILNMILANSRILKGRPGVISETAKVWPWKVFTMADPANDLMEMQMSDVYPSAAQAEAVTLSLAERRVGVNDLTQPRPSQVLGSRTPGITALSMLQQSNRRFAPAFDGMRLAAASAVRQALFRIQEQVRAGDPELEASLLRVLGPKDSGLVLELFRTPDFSEEVSVELTASSVSINREADRQNAILLYQTLAQYHMRILQLVMLATQPQVPPEIRSVVEKIAAAEGEAVDRMIREFEKVRDPETFLLRVDEELSALDQKAQTGLGGISQLLSTLSGMGGNGQAALTEGIPQ